MSTAWSTLDRMRPDGRTVSLLGALLAVELTVLGAYVVVTGTGVLAPRYLLYPFVWINVGVLAVRAVRPVGDAPRRRRLLAGGVAGGYVLLLAWLDGTVGAGMGTMANVLWLPPGWGPTLVVGTPALSLTLFPYRVVGHAVLGYLVYAAVLSLRRGVVGGLAGLFSCVSCTAPFVAAVAGALVGGGAAVTAVATVLSPDLSTLAFVLAATTLTLGATGGPEA